MAKVEYNKYMNEYIVTFESGTKERVSWNAWYAINEEVRKNDDREEARFRTQHIMFPLSDDDLDKIVAVYNINYASDRSESAQWDDAVDWFTKRSIAKHFGEKYGEIIIYDAPGEHGGTDHAGETLVEFMSSVGLHEDDSLYELNEAMEACGVELRTVR
jgi:hypothetical protein